MGTPSPRMRWTPAVVACLRAMWLENASAGEIAAAVGASSSAVQNKAWAEGLPRRREVLSAARKKAWADPDVRARMSAARKKALADPDVRARMSAASKKALADPDVRARMSAARKKAWAKKAVRAAGLPLLRPYVTRAEALFSDGYDTDCVVDALRQERRVR